MYYPDGAQNKTIEYGGLLKWWVLTLKDLAVRKERPLKKAKTKKEARSCTTYSGRWRRHS